MRLGFSREARSDLVRLRAFIAAHDPAAAERVARRLIGGIRRLSRYPRLGARLSATPDLIAPEEIRDWLVADYVIRYLIAKGRVIVLRVWHGKEQRR